MKKIMHIVYPAYSLQYQFFLVGAFIITGVFAHVSSVQSAESFGRLFTTPSERADLDFLRRTTKTLVVNPEQNEEAQAATKAAEVPVAVSMQGYVKRSDGKKGTVWINNNPVQENGSTSEVQIGKLGSGNRVEVKIPANGKRLSLKAGQVYDSESNTVLEHSAHAKLQEQKSNSTPEENTSIPPDTP